MANTDPVISEKSERSIFFSFNSKKTLVNNTNTNLNKDYGSRNLHHLFLQSKPFQNVEVENFLQLLSLIAIIVFGINSLIALSAVRNEFSDSIMHC